MNVLIKKGVKVPEYKTLGAAAFDLCANETVDIMPGETKLIGTGIFTAIPFGYYISISLRSGLASKGYFIQPNAPGIIDSDYRGEWRLILTNISKTRKTVKKGDRVAQGILHKVHQATFVEVDELDETERGEGGFGSTGTN